MTKTFFYGQKNYIDELNNLVLRGPVVGSYSPAPDMSPQGGPNGYITPMWIDPSIPFFSSRPLSSQHNKFGYSFLQQGQPQRLLKLATLLASNLGTYSSLMISGMIGGWESPTLANISLVIGSRTDNEKVNVDWSSDRAVPESVRFMVFRENDKTYSVYLFFLGGSFSQASFNMLGMDCVTYPVPSESGGVTGEAVFDTYAAPGSTIYSPPRRIGKSLEGIVNGTSFSDIVEVRARDGASDAKTYLWGAPAVNSTVIGQQVEVLRLGVCGSGNVNYPGFVGAYVSAGEYSSTFALGYTLTFKARDSGSNFFTPVMLSLSGNGIVYAPTLKAGSTDRTLAHHNISYGTAQGDEILYIGQNQATSPSVVIAGSSGLSNWSPSAAVLYAGLNATTGRSLSVAGTVNTSGNDYAEYIQKSSTCGTVLPGQIVGVTASNTLTDKWSDSVMFAIKSTAPSFVGGDTWADKVGERPSPQAGPLPILPHRREDVFTQEPVPSTSPSEYVDVVSEPGDTDEEWETKIAAYDEAIANHTAAVAADAQAKLVFDAALETERQKVDRIAIAGRVPVNVLGAEPGDYIVPMQDGDGIKGVAVKEDDMTMSLYFRAVGRVITIEPDGRAYVMVKSV